MKLLVNSSLNTTNTALIENSVATQWRPLQSPIKSEPINANSISSMAPFVRNIPMCKLKCQKNWRQITLCNLNLVRNKNATKRSHSEIRVNGHSGQAVGHVLI